MPEPFTKGRLLIAAPTLTDPNFHRTVVLMLEHNDDGALGLVLNRPAEMELAEALPEWVPNAADPRFVFVGGPVNPEGAIGLARSRDSEETDGWSPLLDDLGTVDLGRVPSDIGVAFEAVRVFVGYAGWGPGQLEGELEVGGWLVVDALREDAFAAEPEELWRSVLRRQGGTIAWLANSPASPSLN